MKLLEIGKMAEKYWHEIPEHFPFVKLDAFVVMPNYIHGIIIVDKIKDTQNNVNDIGRNNIGVTKNARKINAGFAWQSRFYDHIIRNEKEFCRIQQYIHNNPAKWTDVQNNQDNVWI